MIVETFFLMEEKRAYSTLFFQDLCPDGDIYRESGAWKPLNRQRAHDRCDWARYPSDLSFLETM